MAGKIVSHLSDKNIRIIDKGSTENHHYLIAETKDWIIEIHTRVMHPLMPNESLITNFIFDYPKTAMYGARRIIERIVESWRITPDMISMMMQSILWGASKTTSTFSLLFGIK